MKKSRKNLSAQELINQVTFEMELRAKGINPERLYEKVFNENGRNK